MRAVLHKIGAILCLFIFLELICVQTSQAQCSMCRTQVENNLSTEEMRNTATGLNTGILYLMSVPYLLIIILAYVWYRKAKGNRASSV